MTTRITRTSRRDTGLLEVASNVGSRELLSGEAATEEPFSRTSVPGESDTTETIGWVPLTE